jgi:hypothetical protein
MMDAASLLARLISLEATGYDDGVGLVALLGKNWQERDGDRRVLRGLVASGAVEMVAAGFYRRRTDPVAS